jgi:hypothetical protein
MHFSGSWAAIRIVAGDLPGNVTGGPERILSLRKDLVALELMGVG